MVANKDQKEKIATLLHKTSLRPSYKATDLQWLKRCARLNFSWQNSNRLQASQLNLQQGLGNTAFLRGCWILCAPHPPSSCSLRDVTSVWSWKHPIAPSALQPMLSQSSFLYLSQQLVAIMMHSSLRTTRPRVVCSDERNWYETRSRKICEKPT